MNDLYLYFILCKKTLVMYLNLELISISITKQTSMVFVYHVTRVRNINQSNNKNIFSKISFTMSLESFLMNNG